MMLRRIKGLIEDRQLSALVTFVYLAFGVLWVVMGGLLVRALFSPERALHADMGKDLLFVALSAALIFWLFQGRERALRERERRFRTMVETTQEGVWVMGADARTTYVNPRMAQLLGYTQEEMLGASLYEFIPEDGQAEVERGFKMRLANVGGQGEFEMQRKDGSRLRVVAATSRLDDDQGHVLGVLGAVTDLTEHTHIETELQASWQRQKLIAEVLEVLNRQGGGMEGIEAALRAIQAEAGLTAVGLRDRRQLLFPGDDN